MKMYRTETHIILQRVNDHEPFTETIAQLDESYPCFLAFLAMEIPGRYIDHLAVDLAQELRIPARVVKAGIREILKNASGY